MLLLIAQAAGLLLGVFLISSFIGWHLAPRPKVKARRRSIFDETLADLGAGPVMVTADVAAAEVKDPMVAAAQTFRTAQIIQMPVASPVSVGTALEPAIMETLDRTNRPKRSHLASMTPESVEAAVEQAGTGLEPHRLTTPEGDVDDLKIISGIGPLNERELNDLGIYHYWQVASWTPEHVAWLSARLHFPKRIVRENWMAQAARMAERAA